MFGTQSRIGSGAISLPKLFGWTMKIPVLWMVALRTTSANHMARPFAVQLHWLVN